MRIAFVWQGFDGRYGQWKDGLWAAMQHIEKQHQVKYFDTTEQGRLGLQAFNPDVVLYWEAPVTINGKDRDNYRYIQSLPYKKALLFAGGQIRKEWVEGFDLLFVESAINEQECAALGIPYRRAFGVNEDAFKPEIQPKVLDGVYQATCASWKRPWLMAEALRGKSAVMGRYQPEDPIGFIRCRELGALVLPELSVHAVSSFINASHTVVNCAEYWGGGQRCTLEAMSCGVPVIVMSDSPKNREFVEESGAGIVVDPDSNKIREAVEAIKAWSPEQKAKGRAYIESKWTSRHYADAILAGIKDICP